MKRLLISSSAHANHLVLVTKAQHYKQRHILHYQHNFCLQVSVFQESKSTVQHKSSSGSLRHQSLSGGRERDLVHPASPRGTGAPLHSANEAKHRFAPSKWQQNRVGDSQPLRRKLRSSKLHYLDLFSLCQHHEDTLQLREQFHPSTSFLPLPPHALNNSIYFLFHFQ